jgi:hypothetical protein
MAQDGLASFEPAFVDELAVIMGWGFQDMQREAGEGGSVYLRLSTRTLEQPQRIMTPDLQNDITEGAYWLREPGPNCDIVIAYTGAVAPEAIEAVGLIGESHRDVGLLAVTSADRLHGGWSAARNLRRERRGIQYLSHVERLLAPLPRDCGIVTVIDGHPAAVAFTEIPAFDHVSSLSAGLGHVVRPQIGLPVHLKVYRAGEPCMITAEEGPRPGKPYSRGGLPALQAPPAISTGVESSPLHRCIRRRRSTPPR